MFSPFIYFEGVIAQPIRVRVAGVSEASAAIGEYARAYLTEHSGALKQAYSSERQNADLAGDINYDKSRQVGDATLTLERYQGRETITVTLPPPGAALPVRVPEEPPALPPAKLIEGAEEIAEVRAVILEPIVRDEEEVPPEVPRVEEATVPHDTTIDHGPAPVFVFVLPNIFVPQVAYMQLLLGLDNIMSGNYVYDDSRVPYSVSATSFLNNEAAFANWKSSTTLLNEFLDSRALWFEQFDAFWKQFREKLPEALVLFVVEPEYAPTPALAAYAQHQANYLSLSNAITNVSNIASEVHVIKPGYYDLGPAGVPALGAATVRVIEYTLYSNPIIGDYFVATPTTLTGWGYDYRQPFFKPAWPQLVSSRDEWRSALFSGAYNVPQWGSYSRVIGGTNVLNAIIELRAVSEFAPTAPIYPVTTIIPKEALTDSRVLGIVGSPGWEFGNQEKLPAQTLSESLQWQLTAARPTNETAAALQRISGELQVKYTDIWNKVYTSDTSVLNAIWMAYGVSFDYTRTDMRGLLQQHAINLDSFRHLFAQLPGTQQFILRDMPPIASTYFTPPAYAGIASELDKRMLRFNEAGDIDEQNKWVDAKVYLIDMNLREEVVRQQWSSLSELATCEAVLTALGANVTHITAARTPFGGQEGRRRRPIWGYSLTPDFELLERKLAANEFERSTARLVPISNQITSVTLPSFE